ncbi:MAG: ATP-binding protein, partial [Planctomycetota bacterium]
GRIRDASRRAGSITRNLLTFSRPRDVPKELANLSRVVEDTVGLVEREFATEGIAIDCRTEPVPDTLMDPPQIGQVALNFLINGRHAVLDRPVRRIEVTTGLDDDGIFARFADTGCGIPPENLSRVFTPFFSTKGEHADGDSSQARVRGTGLGLSISHTIATDHGGEIAVESVPGEGATFTLRLPVRRPRPDTPAPAGAADAVPTAAPGRILIVDDEVDTRELLELLLRRQGHAAESTADGREALPRLHEDWFDVLFVDLQMPLMHGVDLLKEIETLPPDRRPVCLVITGKPAGAVEADIAGHEVFDVLQKPFELEEVCKRARAAIALRRARGGPNSAG